jgi:hypothetical protein
MKTYTAARMYTDSKCVNAMPALPESADMKYT